MRKYRSAIAKHLHGEFKDLLARGDITPERMVEFEKDCFKDTPDAPQGRAAAIPAMAASPETQGRSVK